MTARRVLAAFTLAVTAGCSSLQPVPVEFITEATPLNVQISDGHRTVDVANPRLSGDTVLGTSWGSPVAIPLRRVQRVSTVRFSGARTAMLIGGLAVIGVLATHTVLTRASGDGSQYCDYDIPPMGPDPVECAYPGNP